jgi:hypothetical protein
MAIVDLLLRVAGRAARGSVCALVFVADGVSVLVRCLAARRPDARRLLSRLEHSWRPLGAAILLMPLPWALLPAWALVARPWILPRYDYMLSRFSATAVYDARGRYLGAIPGAMEPWPDWYSPDYKTLYVDRVPEAFLRCLEHLEDRHRGSFWRSRHGVDVPAILRSVAESIATLQRAAPRRFR